LAGRQLQAPLESALQVVPQVPAQSKSVLQNVPSWQWCVATLQAPVHCAAVLHGTPGFEPP